MKMRTFHASAWTVRMDKLYSPLTATLAIFSGTREPNGVVCHIEVAIVESEKQIRCAWNVLFTLVEGCLHWSGL
jgi:hypothetical protein